ncbi:MAG TPA: 2-isopropylmalate synthase [Candidatus Omnitrophica bacterium]|nr:2-isopropylmalate synthase [Candidatus Omnitrophota bacterium]
MKKEKIIIFDTTLRDGEQSPGASLQKNEKLEIAHQLAKLGVDVIEAGFPISSPDDFNAVKEVAKKIKGPVICGLARSLKNDIDAAYNALKPAKRKCIHVFLATSKIHLKYKLKKAEEEILKQAQSAVRYAKNLVDDVEFSPEDASRTDREFLYKVIEAVIGAGATRVNIPDTVGYAIPVEFGSLIKGIKENVPNIDKAVLSVHCHNDLGLGVANSLEAVINGANQVECTINGIGERAGNASLEEIVMSIKTRKDVFVNKYTDIDTRRLCETSRMVSRLTGITVQPNKAIVGINAFSHEAGIHQDGILKKRATYEIMDPKDVGFGESKLVLGKHSGRHAFAERLKKLGMDLSEPNLNKAFEKFKALADKKKNIFDDDLKAIIEDEMITIPEAYQLKYLYIQGGTKEVPTAKLRLKAKGEIIETEAKGDGPVDACYKAIDKVTGIKGRLIDYIIRSVTSGKDALGEVSVRVAVKGAVITGRGTSTDIIEASVKAYLNAVNKAASHIKPKMRQYT